MAKKVILKDHDNNEIMPITRGELILDSSGNEALHSNEFLATDTKPGLMSAEDKNNFDKSSVAATTSTTYWGDSLTVNIKGVEKTLTIPNKPALADLTNNLTNLGNVNAGYVNQPVYFKNGVPTPIPHTLQTTIKFQSDVTTEDTWRKLGGIIGTFIQLNLTSPINISNWSTNGYNPMLVFGVDYNKGFIELSNNRNISTVSFGGSGLNDNQIPWYWKLKGTDTATYTLPTTSSTLVNTAEAANIALTTVQNYLNLNESTLDNLQNLIDLLENNKETIEGLQEIISGYQKIIYDYYPTANFEDTTIKGNILAYSPLTNFDSVGFTFYDTKFYHATSISSNRTQVAYGYSKQSIAIRNYYNGSWNNWKQVAMTDYVDNALTNYVTLNTDQTIRGFKTFIASLKLNTTSSAYIQYLQNDIVKAEVGWHSLYGVFIKNETSQKFLNVTDTGIPKFDGNTLWHEGNLTKLSQLTNDSGFVSGGPYLPLNGGTLTALSSSVYAPLTLKTINDTNNNVIYFANKNSTLSSIGHYNNFTCIANEFNFARIGVTDEGVPQFWTHYSQGNRYTLLHEGNYNSYSPKLNGTGATGTWNININGDAKTIENHNIDEILHNKFLERNVDIDANDLINANTIYTTSFDLNNTPNISFLNFPSNIPSGSFSLINLKESSYCRQFYTYYSNNTIYTRNQYYRSGKIWTDWKQLAFIDNIPTKLSDLTDDVVSGKYLPLSGGTLTNTTVPLTLRSNNTYCGITFKTSNGQATFGLNTAQKYFFVTPIDSWDEEYIIFHTKNYTNYINENRYPGINKVGTVTSIKVGTTSYSPSSGVVSLPAYPTSLPANGGNADTLGGYSKNSFIAYTKYDNYVAARFISDSLKQHASDTYIEFWGPEWYNCKWGTITAINGFIGNLDGTYVNKLTGYTKATASSNIAATDSLNTALGKLEYKAGTTYDWYKSITQDDTDTIINKWGEIVDFIDSVTEGTDITDEFVTRKTEQTITGTKTFATNILTISNPNTGDATLKFYRGGNTAWSIVDTGGNLKFNELTSNTTRLVLYESAQGGSAAFAGQVTATKFITSGGTSSQFVKGDGSLDSTEYFKTSSLWRKSNSKIFTTKGWKRIFVGSYPEVAGRIYINHTYSSNANRPVIIDFAFGYLNASEPVFNVYTYSNVWTQARIIHGSYTSGYKGCYIDLYYDGNVNSDPSKGSGVYSVTIEVDDRTNIRSWDITMEELSSSYTPPTDSHHYTYVYDLQQGNWFNHSVIADKLIKSGGTANQFLKADGSLDSNKYLINGSGAYTTSYLRDININGNNWTFWSPVSSGTSGTVYGPTTPGTSGQYLMSNGSGAPVWTSLPALASPYAIKFKNTAGTEVSYNGSVAVDLTSGIEYAKLASQLSSTRIFGFENKKSSYCKIATLFISSRYNGRYGLLKCYTTLTTIPNADSFEIFICAYQQDALGNPPVIKFKTTNTNNLYQVIGLLNYTSTSSTLDIYIYGYNRTYLSLNTSLISGNIVISPESYVDSLPSGTQITPTPMGNVEMLNGYLDSDFWKKTELTKVSQLANDSGYVTGGPYLPLSGGNMANAATIKFSANGGIIQTTATTSNAVSLISWYKGDSKDTTYSYSSQIGWHNTGDTDGAIYLIPNPQNASPWGGTVGLYIGKNTLKWNNQSIIHSGNIGSQSVNYATSAGKAQYLETQYKDNTNWYGDSYKAYLKWETNTIAKLIIDGYSTKVDYSVDSDKVDGFHATSFAIWRGDASTDSTAKDVASTSTADFFAKIHATSGLFNSRFGAMRGSWWYVGNTQLDTGVGTLEMAGTAVLNLGSYTDTNDTYKSLLFLDQGGRLWSYTANETAVKQWSRYVKTTDKIANASLADTVGDGTISIVPQYNNEINFGGTNAASVLYFGYRAVGSRPIPTSFVFGGSTGTSKITANSFISSVATGTQPYACSSTTVNTNLNADLLDGYHASSFVLKTDLGSAELANNITTISKTLTVTQDWMDTGIDGDDFLSGTYVIQVTCSNESNLWDCYWSGVMSWWKGRTNDTESDEIILHRAGRSYDKTIYLRTIMRTNTDGNGLKLQIASNDNIGSSTYTFKFKRVI